MPRAQLLDDAEIDAALRALPGWTRGANAIERRFTLYDFADAVAFIVAITGPADEQNHHPDVTIHWNEVTLRLWTHASGGVTERDIRLAATIDSIAAGRRISGGGR